MSDMPAAPAPRADLSSFSRFGRSQLLRVLLIGFLILLLQIPLMMIQGVIHERASLRGQATSEIARSWGGAQRIEGPLLVVPFRVRWIEEKDDRSVSRSAIRYAHFLPETLDIDGQLETEKRYRGIFELPVYLADLRFSGRFEKPDFDGWAAAPEDILWDRAELVVAVSDPRAIRNAAELEWGQQSFDFLPGIGTNTAPGENERSGFHANLKNAAASANDGIDFAFQLTLQGNASLRAAPFAKNTTLRLRSNWADPSFQGAWLPIERSVSETGFEAKWQIPFLGRSFPQRWQSSPSVAMAIERSLFGVDLTTMVDEYRMATRSVKYGMLFIALTFGTFWLFEVISGLRVHSIQYLLIGAGLCLFYLLELSLSEHLGFVLAYLLASFATVGLIASYGRAVLGASHRVLSLAGVLIALYGYLFVLLRDQNYALLVGSIGLFGVLAAVMYLTRKIDWSALEPGGADAPGDAG